MATGDNFFSPTTVVVSVGDKVRWNNTGEVLHTVTSGSRPIADGLWDAYLQPGESFTRTFDQPGTYRYFCIVHVGQSGKVTVNP